MAAKETVEEARGAAEEVRETVTTEMVAMERAAVARETAGLVWAVRKTVTAETAEMARAAAATETAQEAMKMSREIVARALVAMERAAAAWETAVAGPAEVVTARPSFSPSSCWQGSASSQQFH